MSSRPVPFTQTSAGVPDPAQGLATAGPFAETEKILLAELEESGPGGLQWPTV
jgi:hypothetical protein